jgi:hypothetical protein
MRGRHLHHAGSTRPPSPRRTTSCTTPRQRPQQPSQRSPLEAAPRPSKPKRWSHNTARFPPQGVGGRGMESRLSPLSTFTRLASGGDHLCTSGLSTEATTSACAPWRGGPCLRPPTGVTTRPSKPRSWKPSGSRRLQSGWYRVAEVRLQP